MSIGYTGEGTQPVCTAGRYFGVDLDSPGPCAVVVAQAHRVEGRIETVHLAQMLFEYLASRGFAGTDGLGDFDGAVVDSHLVKVHACLKRCGGALPSDLPRCLEGSEVLRLVLMTNRAYALLLLT